MRHALFFTAVVASGALAAAAWGSHGATRVHLAYAGESPVPAGIYELAPGGKPVRISTGWNDGFPTWSPDGKSVAFDHPTKPTSRNTTCRIVVASGRSSKPIPGVTADCRGISWGRNGLIAFNDPKNAFWIVKADGSGLRKILSGGSSTLNPAWSPDGKMLAFGNGVAGGITVVGANGRGLHEITKPSLGSGDGFPAWSPDGKEIALVRSNLSDFTWSVMVVRSDGSGSKRLAKTHTQPDFVRPAWTADGSSIVFGSTDGLSIVSAAGGVSRILVPGHFLAQPAVAPK